MTFLRRYSNWIFGLVVLVLFILVFGIVWHTQKRERETQRDLLAATLHLCQNEIAYNHLLDNLSGLFANAAPQLQEMKQQAFYLVLSASIASGKVQPKACETLLVNHNREEAGRRVENGAR